VSQIQEKKNEEQEYDNEKREKSCPYSLLESVPLSGDETLEEELKQKSVTICPFPMTMDK